MPTHKKRKQGTSQTWLLLLSKGSPDEMLGTQALYSQGVVVVICLWTTAIKSSSHSHGTAITNHFSIDNSRWLHLQHSNHHDLQRAVEEGDFLSIDTGRPMLNPVGACAHKHNHDSSDINLYTTHSLWKIALGLHQSSNTFHADRGCKIDQWNTKKKIK